jgi:hypothetical protein
MYTPAIYPCGSVLQRFPAFLPRDYHAPTKAFSEARHGYCSADVAKFSNVVVLMDCLAMMPFPWP